MTSDLDELTKYTVIGLVDLAVSEDAGPQVLIAGVIEGETEMADPEEYSGPDNRYARFCLQTEADSTETAEAKCRAYLEKLFEEDEEDEEEAVGDAKAAA